MAFANTKTQLSVPIDNTVISVTREQRNQAVQGAQLTELVQSLYSIALYDTMSDSVYVSPGLDPGKRTDNAEYFFRVPPKVHEFDEPFATTITNTQDAGKYVESYGSILKSIRISGTTGFRPNKSVSPTIPVIGVTLNQLEAVIGANLNTGLRQIPQDEKTGYDDIVFLRNIFRAYSDLKVSDEYASRVVMLWRNIKDSDYWVVEPEDFRLAQSSGSPLTYDYSISFKTLSRFDFSYTLPKDPLESARAAQRMLARLQDYNQNLLNIFLVVSNQINRFQGYSTFLGNFILAPVLNVINGINAVKTSAFGVSSGLLTQAATLAEAVPEAIDRLVSVSQPQDSVVRALRRLNIVLARILSEPVASDSTVRYSALLIDRYARAYERAGSGTTSRRAPESSPTYIGYERSPAVVGSDTVRPGEDIRDIAFRLLGDRSRWRILVTLNRLRYPYIGTVSESGVLIPGDAILYPADTVIPKNSGLVNSQIQTSNETKNNAQANTPGQIAYGRDLRLQSVFIGGEEITDLVINQRGDLGSVAGVPNIEQAIRVKFITSRGELPAHSKFGAKFPIGAKATPASFNEFRIDALRTILSDARVQNVKDLQFLAVGDTLALAADVVVTDSQDILSTSFALRRF